MVSFSERYVEATKRHRSEVLSGSSAGGALLGVNRVDIKLIEDVHAEAALRGFRWSSDEPPELGGGDTAPNPLSYFLSGLGFCQMVHFAGEAARNGLVIAKIESTVRGKYDRGPERRFLEFEYDLRIESPEPPEKVRAMVEEAERFCFVSNTLARAARLTGNVFLNGDPLFQLSRGPETRARSPA